MKIELSERQKWVLIVSGFVLITWNSYLTLLAPNDDSLLDKCAGLLFFIFYVILGKIITTAIQKKHIFDLWWVSVFILYGVSWVGTLIQYALISKQDRGMWEPIDIILITIACILYFFDVYPLMVIEQISKYFGL